MRVLPLLLVAGCAFDRSGLVGDGGTPDAEIGPMIDADPDAPDADPNAPDAMPDMPDATPGCQTWTAANIADPCDAMFGTPGTITLAAGRNRYDTDTGVLTSPTGVVSTPPSVLMTQSGGPEARVLVLTSLTIPAGTALVGEGTRPLIAIVHGDATIAGTVDVSATLDNTGATSTPGPGGDNVTACGNGIGDPGNPSTGAGGAGGGGGGGFGANGGDGGDGQGGGHGNKGGKGNSNGNVDNVPLRGGCRGGGGGDDNSVLIDDGARPGSGGGAFELTARGAITVSGTITAGGTGGGGVALTNAGGGGGGSGGAILLDGDVTTVSALAKLCANGGGGGEGGQVALLASDPGDNAACVEAPRAPGGSGNDNAGNGGGGSALAAPAGENGSNGAMNAAGGAGGGGAGRIRVHGRTTRNLDTTSTVSPDPTL